MAEKNDPSIGTLNEQTLHLAVKNFIDPDPSHQEVGFLGAVADIKNEDGIFEIETKSFRRLSKKIIRYMGETRVTVVYPVARRTTVVITDKNGAELKRYKSPVKGSKSAIFPMMLTLPPECFLSEMLRFRIIYMDVIQYRTVVSAGKRLRTRKTNRVPVSFCGSEEFGCPDGLLGLCSVPEGNFTAKEFCSANGFDTMLGWNALKVLENAGLISCDKSARAFVYKKI